MLIAFLSLIIIFLFTLVDIFYSRTRMIIKNIAMGISYSLISFMVISLILFAISSYTLIHTYIIIIIFSSTLFLFNLFFIKPNIQKISYLPKSLIILLVFGLLATSLKFGFFGMGQDQGVYQQGALLMIEGENSVFHYFKEYNVLLNQEDRDLFINTMRTPPPLAGLGLYHAEMNELGTIPPGTHPRNSAMLHGLPNMPALLSIPGMIFCASFMMQALTFPYLLSIIFMFMLLDRNLGLQRNTTIIFTTFYAFSPIILWTSKTALTEIYVAFLILLFVYLMSSNDCYHKKIVSVPILAFAVFHISIVTFIPFLVLLFLSLSITRKCMYMWINGILSLIFYLIGYVLMVFVAPEYTFGNYFHIFNILERFSIPVYRDSSQIIYVVIAVIFSLILFIIAYQVFIKSIRVTKIKVKCLSFIFMGITVILLLFIARNWYIMGRNIPYTASSLNQFQGHGLLTVLPNTSIFATLFLSGFVVLVICTLFILFMKKEIVHKENILISSLFIYFIFFMNVMLNEVGYYYYFSRYVAPSLSIIFILGAIIIDKYKIKYKILISAITLTIMLPFSFILIFNKDMTNIDFSSQQKIMSVIKELEPNSVLILDGDLNRFFYLEASLLTETNVFPMHFIQRITDASFLEDSKIYILSSLDYELILSETIINQSERFISKRSNIEIWWGGWQPGPFNLLRVNYEEFDVFLFEIPYKSTIMEIIGL